MVVVCPVCRQVVHTTQGVILRHLVKGRSIPGVCSGSGSPVCRADSCCNV